MKTWQKWLVGVVVVLAVAAALGFVFRDELIRLYLQPTESSLRNEQTSKKPEIVVDKLTTPWSITFLPGGDMLVTERSGQLVRIGDDGQRLTINGVQETSEGGLLGVALAPDFTDSNQLYVYYTTDRNDTLTNQVDRYVFANNELTERREIITNIPAASNHNGGSIAFGPDDKLYITTGDAAVPNLSQDRNSLAGKILRLERDGSIPSDNPFGNATWSYGHRNPQGITWDDKDRLWSVEHGQSSYDELNLIDRGANYGWPTIQGDETAENMRAPIAHSGSNETWAPGGIAYHDGRLYFAGLRGQSLYKVDIASSEKVTLSRLFTGDYGRLRAVTAHDDGIYFSTSNRDGRGSPANDDDKILRFKP